MFTTVVFYLRLNQGVYKMDVLIVEDDKVLSLLITKMVEKLDYNVVGTTARGSEAIEMAKSLKPDLILMDIMLEDDIDGIAATIEFQKDESVRSKVIYVTGNSDSYNKNRAKETIHEDYLIKPISFRDLKQSIENIEFLDSTHSVAR